MNNARILTLVTLTMATLGLGSATAGVTCESNLNPTGILGQSAGVVLNGCLTAPGIGGAGLTPDPSPTPWTDSWIAWAISPITGGYRYQYTFTTGSGAASDISHVLLGLSSDCTLTNGCLTNLNVGTEGASAGLDDWGPQGNSNPGIPGSVYGLKINTSNPGGTYTFSLDSNRIPVWQNFYAKDGNPAAYGSVFAYNTGFGATGSSYYVVAPDSVIVPDVVPEPSFYALLALGLAGIYLTSRRRASAGA